MGQQIDLPGEKHRQMIVFEDTDIKQLENLMKLITELVAVLEKGLHEVKTR